jgi:predicted thioredoxin/glutaredoxin
MKIDVYLAEICGSYYQLKENLDRALSESNITAEVTYHTVYYDDAVSKNIKGSPSIWIDGRDAFPGGNSPGIA